MASCAIECIVPPPSVGQAGCATDQRPGGISHFFWKRCDVVFNNIFDYLEWCTRKNNNEIGYSNELKASKGPSTTTKKKTSSCAPERVTGREQVITFEDYNADDIYFSDFHFYNYLRRYYPALHFGWLTCDGLFFGWAQSISFEADHIIEEDVDGSSYFSGMVSFKSFDDITPVRLPGLITNLSNNCANLGYSGGGSGGGSTISGCLGSTINSVVVGSRNVIGAGPAYLTDFTLTATVPSGYNAEVRYRKVGLPDWTTVPLVGGVIVAQPILSTTNVGTTWEFEVRTVCNNCNSPWSATVTADETVPNCCMPAGVKTNWINSFTSKLSTYVGGGTLTLSQIVAHVNGIAGGATLVETVPGLEATISFNGTSYCDVATLGQSSGIPGIVVAVLTLANRTQQCTPISIGFLYEDGNTPEIYGYNTCPGTLVYDDINNILNCS